MSDAESALLRARKSGTPGTLIEVASLTGFGLRDVNEFAVVIDGKIHGAVLAGLADEQILASTQEQPGDELRSFEVSIADAAADAGGLVCGGTATLTARAISSLDQAALDALAPTTRALVVGSGPMLDAIRAQGELLDWAVEASLDLDTATEFLAMAGAIDALIILSHDRALDIPVLDAALASDIGYIGAMGSRRTQQARAEALAAKGWDEAARKRIHGPVGLDLGSRTPAETAIAIVAEHLAKLNGRSPSSLGATTSPIHG